MDRESNGNGSGKTLTRADLADAIYRRKGLPRSECSEIVESIISEICDAAARGENVKLSSFGTFVIRDKKMRMGRNPKTGDEVPITPRRVMTFKPSNVLRARVNGKAAGKKAKEKENCSGDLV